MTASSRTVHIPVRVSRSQPRSPRPNAPAPIQPPAPSQPKPSSNQRRSIHALPVEQRRRIMWFTVAIGMTLILFGWAMNLGNELRQSGREVGLLQQIGDLFTTFQPTPKSEAPQEQEIRQLEEQVFPQF